MPSLGGPDANGSGVNGSGAKGSGGDASRRLDGWKAIAGYFKRDRSTVMRWARDRDLPVRRLPGGKQGSVFALEHELAAWALRHGDEETSGTESPPPPATVPKTRRWTVAALAVGGVAMAGMAVSTFSDPPRSTDRPRQAIALPADPQAAADFVAARDRWARRTEPDLTAAIQLLERVTRRVPDFAPGFSALADAWLLEREYGHVNSTVSFDAAERAARRAMALDPELPGAHRALGFIAYWRDSQRDRGLALFRRAVTLDDADGQNHFWYANALADAGHDREAQLEYARARLLMPGSAAIEIEHAYSHWLAGRDRQALEQLQALVPRYPANPNLHLCLSWVYISLGDLGSFVRENALVAKYRNEPRLRRQAAALTEAYAKDPAAALALLLEQRREDVATERGTTRQAPTLFASSMADRAATIALMDEAIAAGEHWYGQSVRDHITADWPGDSAITTRLARIYTPTA